MVARCLLDNDDEVRDRALLYLEVLKQKQKALSSAYILNSEYVVCERGESTYYVFNINYCQLNPYCTGSFRTWQIICCRGKPFEY